MLLKKLGSRVLDLIYPPVCAGNILPGSISVPGAPQAWTASAVMAVRRRRSAGSTPGWNCW